MSNGKLIVFEGADKSGKLTQSCRLERSLRELGYRATRIEPAKETHPRMKALIYGMLASGAAKRHPNAFQFLQFCNKVAFQSLQLPKLLRSNDYVILDRWSLSGYVYGSATCINSWLNDNMYRLLARADLTLVMWGDPYRREGEADDSYESDGTLQARVKNAYLKSAAWPKHQLVDNQGTVEEVGRRILCVMQHAGVLNPLFGGLAGLCP